MKTITYVLHWSNVDLLTFNICENVSISITFGSFDLLFILCKLCKSTSPLIKVNVFSHVISKYDSILRYGSASNALQAKKIINCFRRMPFALNHSWWVSLDDCVAHGAISNQKHFKIRWLVLKKAQVSLFCNKHLRMMIVAQIWHNVSQSRS